MWNKAFCQDTSWALKPYWSITGLLFPSSQSTQMMQLNDYFLFVYFILFDLYSFDWICLWKNKFFLSCPQEAEKEVPFHSSSFFELVFGWSSLNWSRMSTSNMRLYCLTHEVKSCSEFQTPLLVITKPHEDPNIY